jgi:uncharacterized oxidoreductase
MLLLDFATSLVAEGKVLVASNGGKAVPHDALIAPDGTRSANPELLYGAPLVQSGPRDAAIGDGALRAFGEHKGSGLAFMCEILAGVLTGGETSGPVPGGKRGRISNGMFSLYLDPAHFGASDFAAKAAEYARYVKASRPEIAGAEVLVPGETEARRRTGWPSACRCRWTRGRHWSRWAARLGLMHRTEAIFVKNARALTLR